VYRAHEVVRARRDDTGGVERAAVRCFPGFPQSGECHGFAGGEADVPGLLDASFLLPFVEAVGGYQAAVALEGGAERGLFGERFAARVDEPVADGCILGPARYQAPVHELQHAPAFRGEDDGGDAGAGGDVVARLQVGALQQPEPGDEFAPGRFQYVSSAHGMWLPAVDPGG